MRLTEEMRKFYFEEKHAVILPAPDEGVLPEKVTRDSRELAATVSANFASLGFSMRKEMTERLAMASRGHIIAFYKEYMPILKEAVADLPNPRVFYPGFPKEVMTKSDAELFIDQVLHYIDKDYMPDQFEEAELRFPFIGKVQQRPLVNGSKEDLFNTMGEIMNSAVAYTPRQVRAIRAFFETYPDAYKCMPETTKSKENMIILGMTQKDVTGSTSFLTKNMKDPIDVLRYAAVRSNLRDMEKKLHVEESKLQEGVEDKYIAASYHKASLQYTQALRPSFALTKADRRFVVKQLERIANGDPERLSKDMFRHRQDWKRLIKNIHISDYPECKAVTKAFEQTSRNVSIDRHDKIVEEAIKVEDLKTALNEAKKRPGDLVARTDKFLRMAKTRDEEVMVLDAVRECVKTAGIARVVGLMSSIKTRGKNETERIFAVAKTNTVHVESHKNRPALREDLIEDVHAACMDGLAEKFRGTKVMGKVYMSPDMKDYAVPANTRNANDAIETYPTGSKIRLGSKEGDIQRLFITWTNMDEGVHGSNGYWGDGRVDIDLSVRMYKEDGSFTHVGWNSRQKWAKDTQGRPLYCYSGDITDGGPIDGKGVAEYMDVNPAALKDLGVRYIVASVISYSVQYFTDQPHTSFGTMARNIDDEGEIFEPQAVTTKMRLSGKCTHEIPAIYDLEEDKLIWVDRQFDGQVASRSDNITPLLDMIKNQSPMTLEELITVNVRGNGEFVSDPRNADTLYITPREEQEMRDRGIDLEGKEIVYPYNLSHITGVLMAEKPATVMEKGRNERSGELADSVLPVVEPYHYHDANEQDPFESASIDDDLEEESWEYDDHDDYDDR